MITRARTRSQLLMQSMQISSMLTARFYRMYRKGAIMAKPEKVIELLNRNGIRFVVMGTHGVGAWRSEPRATMDIDVLIAARDHAKASRVIEEAFPHLERVEAAGVTRFMDLNLNKVLIDLMKPSQPLFKAAFRNTVAVKEGNYRVPNLEMALASKFAAILSPHRVQSKRMIDQGDFIDMVETHGDVIDMKKLKRLAEKIQPGSGDKIAGIVEDIRAGGDARFE